MPMPDGFLPQRWQRIVDADGHFMDRWAVHAAECGWSTFDVFGCHAARPDARFDAMGLVLLLERCEIVAIDERGADLLTATGARQRFYRRPAPAGTVALWDLVRRAPHRDLAPIPPDPARAVGTANCINAAVSATALAAEALRYD